MKVKIIIAFLAIVVFSINAYGVVENDVYQIVAIETKTLSIYAVSSGPRLREIKPEEVVLPAKILDEKNGKLLISLGDKQVWVKLSEVKTNKKYLLSASCTPHIAHQSKGARIRGLGEECEK